MHLLSLGILFATGALCWWLSRYDAEVTGQDRTADFQRRAIRTGVTLLLVAVCLWWSPLIIAAVVPLAVLWAGCLSEIFSGGVLRLVDPEDKRVIDPNQTTRELDELASLVRASRNDEAIELCKKLKESGEASTLAIEAVLFRLYSSMFSEDGLAESTSLPEAQRLVAAGQFSEAVTCLTKILQREPTNIRAAFLLLRIYTRDLARPSQADSFLKRFAQQPHVPPVFVEYARHCLREWCAFAPRQKTVHGVESLLMRDYQSEMPEQATVSESASVDELLAAGYLSSAVEKLEAEVRAHPDDFAAKLKLAEAYGFYCQDFVRAGKVIAQIESNPAFVPQQVEEAKMKMRRWKEESGA